MMCCTYIYNFSYLSFLKLSVFPSKGDLRLNLFSLVFFQFNPEAGDCFLTSELFKKHLLMAEKDCLELV